MTCRGNFVGWSELELVQRARDGRAELIYIDSKRPVRAYGRLFRLQDVPAGHYIDYRR